MRPGINLLKAGVPDTNCRARMPLEALENDASGRLYVFAVAASKGGGSPVSATVLTPDLELERSFDLALPTGATPLSGRSS